MGSVDPGYGTAFLARVVGEKKAREIWYLNNRYSGQEAVAMGLANVCVPHEQLDADVQEWAETICERSPTAIAIAKRSFNMDTAHQARHRRPGHVRAEAVLRHRRVARGRQCAEGEAQARLPQVREVRPARSTPRRSKRARFEVRRGAAFPGDKS